MIKRFIIAFIVLVAVGGGVVGFNLYRERAIEQFFATMKRPPVAVSTTDVEAVTWQPTIGAIGTVSASNGVNLTTEVPGVVKQILFAANQDVTLGQELVGLDNEAQLADLNAAQSQLALDKLALQRALELRTKGVGSQSALDSARAAETAQTAQVAKLQAVVDQKRLRAPFDGTIGIPQIDLGQYVSPGQVVATLQDLDTMYADFTVTEQQFGEVTIGQPVRLGPSGSDTAFAGKITGIDPRIDPSSRLASVRAEISNPDRQLNPGQFVEVSVELPVENDIIAIPQTAVITSLYGDYVYRIKTTPAEGGGAPALTVDQVFVKTGRSSGGEIEILDGVKAGDQLVNAGQNRLSNGARVTINNSLRPVLAKGNVQ